VSKKAGVLLLSFALMAPCVLFLGVPFIVIGSTIYRTKRDFDQKYPGSGMSIAMGPMTVNGRPFPIYVFAIAAILMFIIGLVLLIRGSLAKHESDPQESS
jgi:amino acid transporter